MSHQQTASSPRANSDTEQLVDAVRQALAPSPELDLVILFGSAATAQLGPDSDIDIAVAGAIPLAAPQKRAYTEALALALGRPIDLIDLHTAAVPLLKSILATGQILQKRDPAAYARILRRLWRWDADQSHNHERFLRRRRQNAFSR